MFKKISIFILVFLLAANTSAIGDSFPLCKGAPCKRVAQYIEWPHTQKTDGFEVLIQKLLVTLPPEQRRISFNNGVLNVYYRDPYKAIQFEAVDSHKFCEITDSNPQTVALSQYSLHETLELAFTKTSETQPPPDPNDRYVWQRAMLFKSTFFEENNLIQFFKKAPITVYLVENSKFHDYEAFVLDQERPDFFVKVYTNLLTLQEFKQILASIKVRQGQ